MAQKLAQWLKKLSKGRDIFPVEVKPPIQDTQLTHANSPSHFSIKAVSLVTLGAQKLPKVKIPKNLCHIPDQLALMQI